MSYAAPYLTSTATALVALHTGPFTITGWFEPTVGSDQYSGAGQTYTPTVFLAGPAWSLSLDANGTLSFLVYNSVSEISTIVTTTQPINSSWSFWAVVYDQNSMSITLWLNGVSVSTTLLALADSTLSSVSLHNDFELGDPEMISSPAPDGFSLDAVGVWARALSAADIGTVYNAGQGNPYPFLGGAFTLIFQASLVNDDPTPLIICSQNSVFSVSETTGESSGPDSGVNTYQAFMNLLYQGVAATPGYNWTADNFSDKVILAQHDNIPLYWTPPSPLALPLPGLPSGSQYDGVAIFTNHVLLWQGDNLVWSDVDNFTNYIPIAATVVSSVLTLTAPFVQPPPGGNVTVQVTAPTSVVASLSISGSLAFPPTLVGSLPAQALLLLENTGNTPIEITGISLPAGFTASSTTGTIAIGGSKDVIVYFTPTQSISYSGTIVVGATSSAGTPNGTLVYPVSGTGTGATAIINLTGNLDFGSVVVAKAGHPQPGSLTGYLLVTNPGNTALNITGLVFSSPGFHTAFTTGTVPGTTSPSEPPGTLVIPITFTPTAVTSYTGDITVNSNATSGVNFVAVSGVGVASLLTPSVFINDNGACQFGFLNTGNTSPAVEVTITNVSGVVVNVFPILPTNVIPGFIIGAPATGGPGHGLAPYASTTFSVTFQPTLVQPYSGSIAIVYTTPGGPSDYDSNSLLVSGTGTSSGPQIEVSGSLNYGDVPYGSMLAAMLSIYNPGQSDLIVSGVTYPSAVFTGPSSVTVAPGATVKSLIYFTPAPTITSPAVFSGDILATTNVPNGLGGFIPVSYPISGTGIPLPVPVPLVADQVVTLTDTSQPGQTYYDYYTVTAMTGNSLSLILMDLTGATPAGNTIVANGVQFFTLDANEAGSTVIAGARANGPILKIIPQGDFAYSYKSRSIQSIQYTGLGNGTFFIHNEISGEGLIGRNAVTDSGDGRMFFLGWKELYLYEGGPKPQPICQQYTRQLYVELDRTRLDQILLFHNENRKEVWVIYPISGGTFKVLIWNYVEDSAAIDIYSPTGGINAQFTAIGLVDWSADPTWLQFALPDVANETTWLQLPTSTAWDTLVSAGVSHAPIFGSVDGGLRIHGTVYDREGAGYPAYSETMDYDLGAADNFKYVDVVVLALQLTGTVPPGSTMYVQVGTQQSLSGGPITWTNPFPVLVDGTSPLPVKVNPGGSGRYIRLRFFSQDADVQWRISQFEIHCRPGGFY
jgi:concanavalin A-like lectin/glucanase superfamily protein